jgi:hypothetical protein
VGWPGCGFTATSIKPDWTDIGFEVSGQGADIGPVEQAHPDHTPRTGLTEYPRLKRLEPELSQDHSADEFDDALETLLERIDLLEHHRTTRGQNE